jgi:anaerobic magnesium-protoporphyrin IX monomethyl ester cyclase
VAELRILYLPDQYSQQRQKQKPAWIYPVRLAMEATLDRDNGHHVTWEGKDDGTYDEIVTKPRYSDFCSLPSPDRILTNAFDDRYQLYGNYKLHPATHMQVADGCWWGRCTFCVENGRPYQVRTLPSVLKEIKVCQKMGFKEIFDDSGTFPDGKWMRDFCNWVALENTGITFGCNLRVDSDVDFKLMKKAGFRMILVGVESANQKTLNNIRKGINEKDIIPFFKRGSEAGLELHVATMYGQEGETKEDEHRTLELVHRLLCNGYARTAQASIVDTGNGRRDTGMVNRIYEAGFSPFFWFHQLLGIRRLEDVAYLFKGIKKGIFHD